MTRFPARRSSAATLLALRFKYLWLAVALCADLTVSGLAADTVVHHAPGAAKASSAPSDPNLSAESCSGMPRYYVGSYAMLDDNGQLSPVRDDTRLNAYLDEWRTKEKLKERILDAAPTKECTAECPCDELLLSERVRKNGQEIERMYLKVMLRAHPAESHSDITPNDFEVHSSFKVDFEETRRCVAVSAKINMATHDDLHATSHAKTAGASPSLQHDAVEALSSFNQQNGAGEVGIYAADSELKKNAVSRHVP